MQNEAGDHVDLYVPSKCSSARRIINSKYHASVQVVVANVDEETGGMTGESTNYCICGFARGLGESDDTLNSLSNRDKVTVALTNLK